MCQHCNTFHFTTSGSSMCSINWHVKQSLLKINQPQRPVGHLVSAFSENKKKPSLFFHLSFVNRSALASAGRAGFVPQFPGVLTSGWRLSVPRVFVGLVAAEQEDGQLRRLSRERKLLWLRRQPQYDWVLGLLQLLHRRAATASEYDMDKWCCVKLAYEQCFY